MTEPADAASGKLGLLGPQGGVLGGAGQGLRGIPRRPALTRTPGLAGEPPGNRLGVLDHRSHISQATPLPGTDLRARSRGLGKAPDFPTTQLLLFRNGHSNSALRGSLVGAGFDGEKTDA